MQHNDDQQEVHPEQMLRDMSARFALAGRLAQQEESLALLKDAVFMTAAKVTVHDYNKQNARYLSGDPTAEPLSLSHLVYSIANLVVASQEASRRDDQARTLLTAAFRRDDEV